MKKIEILFTLIILCFASTVCAKEVANIPSCSVTLSGQSVDNSYRQYPLLQYKDIVYFPMTYYDCRFLGVATKWNADTNTLEITKENISGAYRNYNWEWKNGKSNEISICNFNIIVNGKEIDNKKEEYPLITFRDVTYFPLTWRFAVDEFGWEYSYDDKNGLVINADNYICKTLNLPDLSTTILPTAASDGDYYYYLGNNRNIYRTPVNNITKNEIIHTMNESHQYTSVDFSMDSEKNIYMRYHLGGATTGTTYRYKINPDGSTTENYKGSLRTSFVGGNKNVIDCGDYTIEIYNGGHMGSSRVFFIKDDVKKEILLEGVRFGEKRFADTQNWDFIVDPQCIGNNVYLTGYTENDNSDSRLYCFNTATEEISPIAESVGSFFAFTGWDNGTESNSDMIVFERGGKMHRYSSASKKTVVINENSLPIVKAVYNNGLYIYTETKERAVVEYYDGYGIGSIQGAVLLDTTLGTDAWIIDGILCTQSYFDKEGEDIKTCVFNRPHDFFRSSDCSNDIFIYDNILLYTCSNKIIEVNLNK